MKENIRAFSLVEVVLALGIVSFGLVSMVALVPIGLDVYQTAQTATIQAEIVRQISNELKNSPYSSLFDSKGGATSKITGFERYYDVEGRDVTALLGSSLRHLPSVYKVTLSGNNATVDGSADVFSTMTGLKGSSTSEAGSGASTSAGQSLAQTIRINLLSQNKTDVFSILVVNKGY